MNTTHMTIALVASIENTHAKPTNVRLAMKALHMIAPESLLDWRAALRTISDVILLLPLLKSLSTF